MTLPILMYHQIDVPPPSGTPMRGMSVAPAVFARQMAVLAALGYRGVGLPELLPYLAGERRGKVVGLTFDDGYLNNLSEALPVLRRHGFTATCYAVSGHVGGCNDWDAANGVPQKRLMDAQALRDWCAAGMDVGAHTRHHVDLTALEPSAAREEILASRRELEALIDREVRHFCYPYGRYDSLHVDFVREAGFWSATTVRRGRAQLGDSPFELPRVLVAQATRLPQFLLKLFTGYEDRRGAR
ncbi:MAG: polysaccharide deacetylase family protein [Halothiobacillaceae bacterium]|jgi:peptidoglycan/xylan/chitin deacetylase (PgdA/CDA1 family)|nr:polysaccharide deacetylase family protein [Halothiobacillaceae bacterium]